MEHSIRWLRERCKGWWSLDWRIELDVRNGRTKRWYQMRRKRLVMVPDEKGKTCKNEEPYRSLLLKREEKLNSSLKDSNGRCSPPQASVPWGFLVF